MKNVFVIANFVIAAVFLALLLYSFDFNSLLSQLSSSNPYYLLAAIVSYLAAHVLQGMRYKMLLPSFAFLSVFSSHMKAMLASDATPGRIGYSFFIFDMRKKGLKGGRAAKVLGVSLASDFVVRGLLALAAVFLFSQDFGQVGLLVLGASAIAMALLFYRIDFFAEAISKLPFYGKKLEGAYDAVFKQKTSLAQLLSSIGLSAIGAVLRGLEWLFVLNAVGLNAGIAELVVTSALLTALSFVPLSISGFGLQEGGGILLFTAFLAFTVPQAAGAMLLIRFVDLLADSAVGGWFFVRKNAAKKSVKVKR
ncbi:MAG: lysylphosphatidylglycerol synthase transmembrane domain-containing protein [Candidatus Norongarragalinales archaeon]